jgi:hypothetical protein
MHTGQLRGHYRLETLFRRCASGSTSHDGDSSVCQEPRRIPGQRVPDSGRLKLECGNWSASLNRSAADGGRCGGPVCWRSLPSRGQSVMPETEKVEEGGTRFSRGSVQFRADLLMRDIDRSCTAALVGVSGCANEGPGCMPLQDKRLAEVCGKALQTSAIFSAFIPWGLLKIFIDFGLSNRYSPDRCGRE